jgi:hypothetical protein
MRNFKILLSALLVLAGLEASARFPDHKYRPSQKTKVEYRDVCAASKSQIDQDINNVRARLLGGGDCWWDFSDGRYIVPKVDVSTGQREVSSIFAGSVWLGGFDPGGSLKLACQDYRTGGRNDFWPGPLQDGTGTTDQFTCSNWDKHFKVLGKEIRQHLLNIANGNQNPGDIPIGVRGWPANNNPYFADVWGFDLPVTMQGLAGFYDVNGNNSYEPLDGDYPTIEIRGCPLDRYPDEMVFWIYNDQGGGAPHAVTNGKTIQMEVQVQAFGYVTNDELNDMTFQRYKLINRATERIDSCFFAMWIDADLGCSDDDYIGCDTAKSLMYIYNQDATDGQPGITCAGGVATYADKVPILGCDYFRGPLDTFGNELGMSSFMYYNRTGTGGTSGTWDPTAPGEYYNYITGTWRDNTPLTFGGSGYVAGGAGQRIRYCFTETPDDPNGWNMCNENLQSGDRRTLQASGPFTLKPGALNELIIGIPWVPEQDYPCPNMDNLFRADALAQGLFDNCFKLLDGPDAPTVDWIEVHEELIAVLTNTAPSNNVREAYRQQDFLAPESLKNNPDSLIRETTYYKFEGYLIYQLQNPNVTTAEFDDTEKSRLVYNVDIKNNVTKIYNWIEGRDPATNRRIYFPEEKVAATDEGIRHTFSIKEDKFATGNNKNLINHRKYYYAVVAYAYNNFETFDPLAQPAATGQPRSYLPGRKSGNGDGIQIYTVIPRPVVDQALQASYGDGVEITRLEGVGAGGNFLDLTDESRRNVGNGNTENMTYKAGRAPIDVTIFNPFEIKDGEYEIYFTDSNPNDNKLDDTARWNLRLLPDGIVLASERTIAELNEQLVAQYGFSVTIAQTGEPGDLQGETNGAIGMEVEYDNPNQPWLVGYNDQTTGTFPFDFVRTTNKASDPDYDPNGDGRALDPDGALSQLGFGDNPEKGWFVPYVLANWRYRELENIITQRMISPAWQDRFNAGTQGQFNAQAVFLNDEEKRRRRLAALPNVDIVLTSDTSKWSRCVVLETAGVYWTDEATYGGEQAPGQVTESPSNRERVSFDVRYGLSVSKRDANGDGLPDPDGALNPSDGAQNAQFAGSPMRGMGWFPGYAVNVETGERLNIFFGENSCYNATLNPNFTGRDMLWNPTNQVIEEGLSDFPAFVMGGHHYVYVAYSKYDGCDSLRQAFTPERFTSATLQVSRKVPQVTNIAWAGMLQTAPGYTMRPLAQGLIPNDVRIKLRVDNKYATSFNSATGQNNAHPRYRFKINGKQSQPLSNIQVENALDSIKAVPNPYYGFSQYETSQFTNTIKITNLPAKCTVTIYSLDGKFIRQYIRNEEYSAYNQISPAVEWDLKNSKGIPVASGVYLFHVNAPGMGERTVKWFGVGRQFDPSGL